MNINIMVDGRLIFDNNLQHITRDKENTQDSQNCRMCGMICHEMMLVRKVRERVQEK